MIEAPVNSLDYSEEEEKSSPAIPKALGHMSMETASLMEVVTELERRLSDVLCPEIPSLSQQEEARPHKAASSMAEGIYSEGEAIMGVRERVISILQRLDI